MIETLHFLWLALQAFRAAGESGSYYKGRFGPGVAGGSGAVPTLRCPSRRSVYLLSDTT
jgi:hypothetical protein